MSILFLVNNLCMKPAGAIFRHLENWKYLLITVSEIWKKSNIIV